MDEHEKFLLEAIRVARQGMNQNSGGPFGCVIVKDGKIIASGCNMVTSMSDPTAHAEMVAIRKACLHLNSYQLSGCTLYASCEPCPMCMGAIYWSRPDRVFFAASRHDAANAGFDDAFIYEEMNVLPLNRKFPFVQISLQEASDLFKDWISKSDKMMY
jgi:Cytosine/adenosine deaminases